jgi:hypothetical protein
MTDQDDLGDGAHGPITFDDGRDPKKLAAIRALNDRFRTTLSGGRVLMTAGVAALAEETTARVLTAVRSFTAFTADNDPWREHDFGAMEVDGNKIFFKIDCLCPTCDMASEDAADTAKTVRVMTIMLASEY